MMIHSSRWDILYNKTSSYIRQFYIQVQKLEETSLSPLKKHWPQKNVVHAKMSSLSHLNKY